MVEDGRYFLRKPVQRAEIGFRRNLSSSGEADLRAEPHAPRAEYRLLTHCGIAGRSVATEIMVRIPLQAASNRCAPSMLGRGMWNGEATGAMAPVANARDARVLPVVKTRVTSLIHGVQVRILPGRKVTVAQLVEHWNILGLPVPRHSLEGRIVNTFLPLQQ